MSSSALPVMASSSSTTSLPSSSSTRSMPGAPPAGLRRPASTQECAWILHQRGAASPLSSPVSSVAAASSSSSSASASGPQGVAACSSHLVRGRTAWQVVHCTGSWARTLRIMRGTGARPGAVSRSPLHMGHLLSSPTQPLQKVLQHCSSACITGSVRGSRQMGHTRSWSISSSSTYISCLAAHRAALSSSSCLTRLSLAWAAADAASAARRSSSAVSRAQRTKSASLPRARSLFIVLAKRQGPSFTQRFTFMSAGTFAFGCSSSLSLFFCSRCSLSLLLCPWPWPLRWRSSDLSLSLWPLRSVDMSLLSL
mmetsp:Transcript_7433/g.31505  ORF Transcript_7433/g.31505 Transcript_7433/m.31505 type:complete len:311 (-) Transcript_7433:878-1810(-)